MYQKKITGRLGNQMFQYAGMLGIKEMCNIDDNISLCFEKVYEKNFTDDLQMFNVSYKEISKVNLCIEQKIFFYIARVFEKVIELLYKKRNETLYDKKIRKWQNRYVKILAKHGIFHYTKGYYNYGKIKKINKANIYVTGFLESPKYFDNIKEKIQKEFTPKNDRLKKNEDLYKSIENTQSVCLTIRRGDFLNEEFKNEHYVCTPEYFYEGIEVIKKKVENPKFFVFSDDVEWCKKNMTFPDGTEFEEGNDPVWEKLRLMYSCKHFIISNSTFSWWAQYLSRNENKVVIAPKTWKNVGINDDIYEDTWIKI